MTGESGYFVEYFVAAQSDALTERECQILDLRYGFLEEDAHTLKEVGQIIGVSRERIRQIVKRSHRKIVAKGSRQLRAGKSKEPCAELLSYVRNKIRPKESDEIDRLVDFIERHVPHIPINTHALPLVSYLTFGSLKVSKLKIKEARIIIEKRSIERRERYKQQKQTEKFKILLSHAFWPKQIKPLSLDWINSCERARNVSLFGNGVAGTFYSAKLCRSIQYESELELIFYNRLEMIDKVIFYQEQPLSIEYKYLGMKYKYYPDAIVVFEGGIGLVVEIKPVFKMVLHRNLAKWYALREYCEEHGVGMLITDGKRTLRQLEHHRINSDFANFTLSALEDGDIYWKQYKEIKDKFDVERDDFLALVLQNNLIWQLRPFKLSTSVLS